MKRFLNARTGTLLSLLVPGYGIVRAWRARGFRSNARVAMTVVSVVLTLVYVCLIPGAARPGAGGIEYVTRRPQAEIYGPELPEDMVSGYRAPLSGNVLSDATEQPVTYVYTNDGDEFYHTSRCKRMYASSSRLTAYEAYYLGLKPCTICNPEVYTPET